MDVRAKDPTWQPLVSFAVVCQCDQIGAFFPTYGATLVTGPFFLVASLLSLLSLPQLGPPHLLSLSLSLVLVIF